ncbi:MAG TPA: bifunctional enoyl-CoA hydratase/phosphate acetyltransferase [Firmicutes bacterium]|nr:bifunctional enoyl-CoA hydratase/phosphate acetyltransferase [Bacillota bacterium]
MITSFKELVAEAARLEPQRLVVAAAEDGEVLKAVKMARAEGLIEPVLVGAKDKIEDLTAEVGLDPDSVEIIDAPSLPTACQKAVQLVASGAGDLLMKGLVDTAVLMRAVLNKEWGLRTERLISHIAMIETEFMNRLIFVTDGGINIRPDLLQKKMIIENAIDVTKKLGYTEPKVAVLAAIEKVNEEMPETVDAAALTQMAARGQITGGLVDGPLAIDNALSKEAAAMKGIQSDVAGRADILLVPDIVSGNILGKSPIYFANGKIAAIIGGTSKPVVLTSRANTDEIKLISIAAAVLMGSN